MLKRYAVLTGFSNNSGFQQKSLCDIYDFLKSSSGGAWFDKEILILPEGVDEAMLKFILRRVSKDGTEFLFLYFCGNGNDRLTSDGFSVGGEKIKCFIIEETCKAQITVFDACTALVPVDDDSDYEVNDDARMISKLQGMTQTVIFAGRTLAEKIAFLKNSRLQHHGF